MPKAKGSVTVGIKTVNITGKVLIERDLFDRLKDAVEQITDNDELSISESLALRNLVRQLVEGAQIA